MKNPVLLICFLTMFLACKKEEPSTIPSSAPHVFFKNHDDMVQQIQSVIAQRYPSETLHEITNVSYIDSKDKSYALVFYKSSKRSGNLLLERKYNQGVLYSASTGTCEGTGCNCQVVTTISSAGDVKISCSCSSCTMLVNQLAIPASN
jgi:hypothetical protein